MTTRVPGAAAARDVERSALASMLESSCSYVQVQADNSPNPKQAIATIKAAGLDVWAVGGRYKPILTVTQAPANGFAALSANAAALGAAKRRKTSFNWEYTPDGGKTWIALLSTPKAKTTVSGLTALQTYGFRVSLTSPDGIAGPWSQIVSFLCLH